MERLAQVLEIDKVSRAARIQAGILGPQLERRLQEDGLSLRHFPQSFEFSTLGGWLATRAGGHFATSYTHIDDLTESIRMVTPSGIAESRRLPGSGAGPAPDRLALGSEGTLGVITEAWMRLQDRPRFRASASVTFADYDSAVEATRVISQAGLYPSNCRLLDPVEAYINVGTATTGGLLILGFESAHHPVEPSLAIALEICAQHRGTAQVDPGRAEKKKESSSQIWRSSFVRMPYQRDALAAQSMIVETFETACTWDHFSALKAAVEAAVRSSLAELQIQGVLTCRFSHVYPDVPAPYFGVYAFGTWGRTVEQWDHLKASVSDALIDFQGTITHHHAVGRDHRPWYDRQIPSLFRQSLAATKAAWDPAAVLNPGVLVDPHWPEQ